MPDPHVDGGNGKKAMVYNTKREKKERGGGEKEGEKKKVKTGVLSSHSIRACPRILFVQIYVYNPFLLKAIIQYLCPRFKLAFSPALYKFIVRAL